jgi:hypothetical protein
VKDMIKVAYEADSEDGNPLDIMDDIEDDHDVNRKTAKEIKIVNPKSKVQIETSTTL